MAPQWRVALQHSVVVVVVCGYFSPADNFVQCIASEWRHALRQIEGHNFYNADQGGVVMVDVVQWPADLQQANGPNA
jgi:hypothetical protein